MFKNILKHFLWGKVGKYQIFFVTLQSLSVISHTECRQRIKVLDTSALSSSSKSTPKRFCVFGDPA